MRKPVPQSIEPPLQINADDNLMCEGVRLRNHANSRPCPIAVNIRLDASAEKTA